MSTRAAILFVIAFAVTAWSHAAEPATRPARWTDVRSFAYQLQNADLAAIANTKFDLVVIDYSADGSGDHRYTAAQIAAVQHSPAGRKRVLAYLSIGEAENYRFYWQKSWSNGATTALTAPSWLGPENPDWKGNFKVRYWDKQWQRIVLTYLDQILDAGYDGVYLDCVDSFEYWGPGGEAPEKRKTAARDMADLVEMIAHHARVDRHVPDFAIFPQNGEALARFPDYLAAVTGIGREDVFFNGNKRNKGRDVTEVTRYLDQFKRAGKLVMTIDYPTRHDLIEEDYRLSEAKGYVPYVTVRALDRLIIHPGHELGS